MSKAIEFAGKIARSGAAEKILRLGEIVQGLIPDPLVATSASAAHATVNELRTWIRDRDDRRIRDFHIALLKGDGDSLSEPNSSASIEAADFHALLAACLADIEEEKTNAYANLTKAIALGVVDKELRRHFITSLRDITWDYLDYLRRVYIVSSYQVMPSKGAGRVQAEKLLKNYEPGSVTQLAVTYLSSKLFVEGTDISELGKSFVVACSSKEELTPYSFGYEVWSNLSCVLIFLGDDTDNGLDISMALDEQLRRLRVKPAGTALKGMLVRKAWDRPVLAKCIVITRSKELTSTEIEGLRSFLGKRGVLHVNVGADGHQKPLLENFMQIDDPIKGAQLAEVAQRFVRYASLNR